MLGIVGVETSAMWTYDEIAASFRAKHIMTPWAEVLTVPHDRTRKAARRALSDNRFNFAPCMLDGDVVGIVNRANLTGSPTNAPCSESMRPLRARDFVEAESKLANLLPLMKESSFYLVVSGNALVGVVSPTDLNKQPVRTYFYLLLADLETGLVEFLLDALWRERIMEAIYFA
jgi:CBS-domain-containing membrane protein